MTLQNDIRFQRLKDDLRIEKVKLAAIERIWDGLFDNTAELAKKPIKAAISELENMILEMTISENG